MLVSHVVIVTHNTPWYRKWLSKSHICRVKTVPALPKYPFHSHSDPIIHQMLCGLLSVRSAEIWQIWSRLHIRGPQESACEEEGSRWDHLVTWTCIIAVRRSNFVCSFHCVYWTRRENLGRQKLPDKFWLLIRRGSRRKQDSIGPEHVSGIMIHSDLSKYAVRRRLAVM